MVGPLIWLVLLAILPSLDATPADVREIVDLTPGLNILSVDGYARSAGVHGDGLELQNNGCLKLRIDDGILVHDVMSVSFFAKVVGAVPLIRSQDNEVFLHQSGNSVMLASSLWEPINRFTFSGSSEWTMHALTFVKNGTGISVAYKSESAWLEPSKGVNDYLTQVFVMGCWDSSHNGDSSSKLELDSIHLASFSHGHSPTFQVAATLSDSFVGLSVTAAGLIYGYCSVNKFVSSEVDCEILSGNFEVVGTFSGDVSNEEFTLARNDLGFCYGPGYACCYVTLDVSGTLVTEYVSEATLPTVVGLLTCMDTNVHTKLSSGVAVGDSDTCFDGQLPLSGDTVFVPCEEDEMIQGVALAAVGNFNHACDGLYMSHDCDNMATLAAAVPFTDTFSKVNFLDTGQCTGSEPSNTTYSISFTCVKRPCSGGKYFDDQVEQCTHCPDGRYRSGTTCVDTEPGKFSWRGSGAVSCLPGTFQAGNSESSCSFCEPGLVQAQSGQAQCESCSPGFAAGFAGMRFCTECSGNTYSDVHRATACLDCPLGTVRDSGTSCLDCNPGQHRNATMVRCEPCQPGYFSHGPVESCEPCAPGRYAGSTGESACLLCPVETYAPDYGYSTCLACKDTNVGSQNEGAAGCEGCKAGEWSSETGGCEECPAGKFAPASSEECYDCPTGQFSAESAVATCGLCDLGRFANATGSTQCMQCEPGFFANLAGASTCQPCSAGTYSQEEESTTCISCTAGLYSANSGATNCHLCDVGTYGVSHGGFCEECDRGRYQDQLGETTCIDCPLGLYSGGRGKSACVLCTLGRHRNDPSNPQCQECETGRYTDELTVQGLSGECKECSPGLASEEEGQRTSCRFCDAGEYVSNYQCTPCQQGYYAEAGERTACTLCPVGRFSNTLQASSCDECEPGTFVNFEGAQGCSPCMEAQYARELGATVCESCPIGKGSENGIGGSGSSTCLSCMPGRFGSAGLCEACPKGLYSDEEGFSACIKCNVTEKTIEARFDELLGSTGCAACPEKETPNLVGDKCISLDACVPGFFRADVFSACEACPSNSYTDDRGMSECLPCGVGHHAPHFGSVACSKCDAGWSNNQTGASCTRCPVGFFSSERGMSNCLPCSPGLYAKSRTQRSCDDCELGTFSEAEGSSVCQSCKAGLFNDALGTTACQLCPIGKFSSADESPMCEECQPGLYAEGPGSTSCTLCPGGKYSPVTMSTTIDDCTLCDPGRYALSGWSTCLSCQPGYNDLEGQTFCKDCPPNSWTLVGSGHEQFNLTTPAEFTNVTFTPATNVTMCKCWPGYFGTYGSDCKKCPNTVSCEHPATTVPTPKPGHWVDVDSPSVVLRCTPKKACPGTVEGTGKGRENETPGCFAGYEGRGCAKCRSTPPLYYRLNSECKECPDSQSIPMWALGLVVVGLIILVPYFFRGLRLLLSGGKAPSADVLQGFFQVFVNFAQVLAIFDMFDLDWPYELEFVIEFSNIFLFDMQLMRPECSVQISFRTKWMIMMSLPLIMLGRQLLMVAIAYIRLKRRKSGDTKERQDPSEMTFSISRPIDWKRFVLSHWEYYWRPWKESDYKSHVQSTIGTMTLLMNIIYPQLVKLVVEIFDCSVNTDGTAYMDADASIRCSMDDPEWRVLFPLAVMGTLVYVIMVPIGFGYMLVKQRDRLLDGKMRRMFGPLYQRYEKKWFWFEIVVMFRKVAIALSAQLLSNSTLAQALCTMSLLFFSVLVEIYARPYAASNIDRAETTLLITLLIVLMSGILFKGDVVDGEAKTRLAIIVVVIIMVALLFFFVFMGRELYLRREKSRAIDKSQMRNLVIKGKKLVLSGEDLEKRILKSKRNIEHQLLKNAVEGFQLVVAEVGGSFRFSSKWGMAIANNFFTGHKEESEADDEPNNIEKIEDNPPYAKGEQQKKKDQRASGLEGGDGKPYESEQTVKSRVGRRGSVSASAEVDKPRAGRRTSVSEDAGGEGGSFDENPGRKGAKQTRRRRLSSRGIDNQASSTSLRRATGRTRGRGGSRRRLSLFRNPPPDSGREQAAVIDPGFKEFRKAYFKEKATLKQEMRSIRDTRAEILYQQAMDERVTQDGYAQFVRNSLVQ